MYQVAAPAQDTARHSRCGCPRPKALAAALNGTLSTAAAAEQAQADLEEIAQTINEGEHNSCRGG